jgi:UDP-N-acetyl-D-glucosamine dehydrogenase
MGKLGYNSFRAAAGLPAATRRPVVCIQGLGFVGSAMAIAVAAARRAKSRPWYNVVGLDLSTPLGSARVDALNAGRLPFAASDRKLALALRTARREQNLAATTNPSALSIADVIVVDVHCDVVRTADGGFTAELAPLIAAVRTVGDHARPGALIVIETTVPPGTCEKVIYPELQRAFKRRRLPEKAVRLAHSYERVMPGDMYLDSITRYWRVYAGVDDKSAEACRVFLSRIIDVRRYPLSRVGSLTASETAKVLENSYRATNIAFIEEWARFAEAVGVDLFEVIKAIRMRPTHSNIRQPGFGVGGYCLTKDPLLAAIAARELHHLPGMNFEFSTAAVQVNNRMPLVTLAKVEELLGGSLRGKRILLLGVSYRPDVGDTRYSPSQPFVEAARERGAELVCHDPLVSNWPELSLPVRAEIPNDETFDAVVLAVHHQVYSRLDWKKWPSRPGAVIFDAANVLSDADRVTLRKRGFTVSSIGRGASL